MDRSTKDAVGVIRVAVRELLDILPPEPRAAFLHNLIDEAERVPKRTDEDRRRAENAIQRFDEAKREQFFNEYVRTHGIL